jgi:hypothetical protein
MEGKLRLTDNIILDEWKLRFPSRYIRRDINDIFSYVEIICDEKYITSNGLFNNALYSLEEILIQSELDLAFNYLIGIQDYIDNYLIRYFKLGLFL